MAKKANKYSGMADMFEQFDTDQLIAQKTKELDEARARLEEEIRQIEKHSNPYDSGLSDVEDRNEINNLRNEIRYLEQRYQQEIAALTDKTK